MFAALPAVSRDRPGRAPGEPRDRRHRPDPGQPRDSSGTAPVEPAPARPRTAPGQAAPARPGSAPGQPRRRHFLQPARAPSTRGQPAPTPPFPGASPARVHTRPELRCQAGDGARSGTEPPNPAQHLRSTGSQCGRKHRPLLPYNSLFGKGLAAHSSASASFPREETARGRWGGPLAPVALTLSAAVPSAPPVSLPPGRAGPPVRHSTAPPPCPAGPSPRLPRPPRRRAIGCPPADAAPPLAAAPCPSKLSYATFVRPWRSGRTAPKPAAQREQMTRSVPKGDMDGGNPGQSGNRLRGRGENRATNHCYDILRIYIYFLLMKVRTGYCSK